MTADTLTEFLAWYYETHPSHAAMLGLSGYDDTFGDFSAAAFEQRARDQASWLARLEATPASVDRDLALSTLRGELAVENAWPSWRRDPDEYQSAVLYGLLAPFLKRLRPEPELVASAIARLGEVPSILRACAANLDPALASPLSVGRSLEQARTGRAFLQSLPENVADPDLRAKLADATGPAAEAFDQLVVFLEAFTATGDWRMGEKLYSTLLQDKELLGYGAAEVHSRGLAAYASLSEEMAELAGGGDWRAVMESLQDDHPPTEEAMRAEYEAECLKARDFLVEHDLVTLAEGEDCQVVPAVAFRRAVMAVASYLAPPPFSSSRTGHFFVPYTAEGSTPEQIRQRLRTNARMQIPTISVHEAYPGHHWHLSWVAAQTSLHPVRKVFRTPYFSEGWALYAEKLLREHGYFTSNAALIGHVEARLFRAARLVVDTGLHCGDMTPEGAVAYLVANTALTEQTAQREVQRYCAWPTQAPSYLTGALEIDQIRDAYFAAGLGTLKQFHDRIAGSGALPLGLARRVALGED